MNKYNLGSLKDKISTRNEEEIKKNAAARFKSADEILGMNTQQDGQIVQTLPKNNAVRKTFSIPENDLLLIDVIKDKALNKRKILSDSEIVRLGFLVLSELSDEKLTDLSQRIEKTALGRPRKKT